MIKKSAIIIFTGLLIIFFAAMGCRTSSPLGRAAFLIDYLTETLDLTPNQQTQLKQYVTEVFEKGMEMRPYRIEMQKAFIGQLKNETIDQAQLMDQVKQNQARVDEMAALIIKRISDFHQSLTPEQRARLVRKIETFQENRRQFLEKRSKKQLPDS